MQSKERISFLVEKNHRASFRSAFFHFFSITVVSKSSLGDMFLCVCSTLDARSAVFALFFRRHPADLLGAVKVSIIVQPFTAL